MPKPNIKTSAAVCATIAILSACQAETTSQVTSATAEPGTPVAAPVATKASQSQIGALTGRVASASGSWDKGRGGIAFIAQAVNINGETAICGVRAAKGTGSRRFNGQVTNRYSFVIGDQTMLSNVFYFTQAQSIDAMRSVPANCKTTGVPWEAGFATAPWELKYGGGSRFSF